jgi:colicin import membrane protein
MYFNPSDRFPPGGAEGRKVYVFVVLSCLLHLALVVSLVVLPDLAPAKRFTPSVVNVSLVSLPAAGPPAMQAPAAEKKAETPVKPAPVPVAAPPKPPPPPPQETPKEKVSIAPKPPKPKESLKHKTINPSEVAKSSVAKIEKTVQDKRPPSLEETLKRLKQEVAEADGNPRAGPPQTGSAVGPPGGGGMGSAAMADQVRLYQAEIAYRVQKNWAFSEQLAGGQTDIEAALGIKVLASGEISEIWFDRRSGNRHLDESSYRAIVKSNPLPPLPRDVFGESYTVGLRFGPQGIK